MPAAPAAALRLAMAAAAAADRSPLSCGTQSQAGNKEVQLAADAARKRLAVVQQQSDVSYHNYTY
jgi:hypothetical protein